MADKKISQLAGATTPLAGTEVVPIVQSGSTVKVAVSDLTAGRSMTASSIGLGTASPSYPVHVVNAANGIMAVQGGSGTNEGGGFFVRNAAASGTIYAFGDRARVFGGTPEAIASIFTSTQPLTFDINSAERARLTAAGDFGIGTASPSAKLHVAGQIRTDAPTGGTAANWRLGTVATVSPTSPNRTIEVDVGGTIYYIHAKTTNN